jgi:hypothetical protein
MEALIVLILAIVVTIFMMCYCIFSKLENVIDDLHKQAIRKSEVAKKSKSSEHDK